MQTSMTTWEEAKQGGDPEVRDALTVTHLRLVRHVVNQVVRSTHSRVDFDELVSAGTIGLINAIDNFDPSRGLAFSTFAAPRIRGAVLDDLRRRDHAPRSIRRRQRELSRTEDKLSRSLGRRPSEQEVAAELGIDLADLWRWVQDVQRVDSVSLNQPVASGPQAPTIAEVAAPEEQESLDSLLARKEEIQILREEILGLKEQERTVLALYYFEELKLHEIGAMLGVTESRVSQIRSKAIAALRERMKRLREEPA